MEKRDFSQLTDEELLVEKDKLKKSKIWHAIFIGFLAGILIYGFVNWAMSPERRFGFLIPMLIPITFIYGLIKKSKANKDLENVLKERNLN